MSDNIKQCNCKNCLHETRDIDTTADEFVIDGKFYYHKDCHKVNDDIKDVLAIWQKSIDENVNFGYLRRELNRLIYTEGNPSGYVVFCAMRGANSGRLRHVQGLKYYVNNAEIRKEYETKMRESKIRQHKFTVETEDLREPKFSGSSKPTGFGGIFGGKR